MTKRFYYTFACSATVALASLMCADAAIAAGSAPRTREDIAALRASRPRKAPTDASRKSPAKAPLLGGEKQLYGVMYTCYYGDFEGFTGPVEINDRASKHTKLATFGDNAFSGVYFDGKYIQSYYNSLSCTGPVTYVIYDAETWQPLSGNMSFTSSTGVTPDILPCGLTYDHTTGMIYGGFFKHAEEFAGTDDAQFGSFDVNNPLSPVSIISDALPERMRAYATDKDGQIYGLGVSGELYKINKFNGETTHVATVSLYSADGEANYPFMTLGRESIAVDWETGDFYLSYGDDWGDGYIARIDPATGASVTVADYSYAFDDWSNGDCFTGLFFKQSAGPSEDVIPAAVGDLSVSVTSTALTADISFTMPSADTNGEPITGSYSWYVTDGANELASGEAEAGATVFTTVTVPTPGFSSLVVYTSLNGKDSPTVTERKFFGPDTPVVWGTPTARVSGKNITVTWSEAYAENGGQMEPVTYKVTRLPDQVVVAPAVEGVTFTDVIESDYKTAYSYVVEPVAGEITGQAVTSRQVIVGKYISLPLHETFADNAWFLEYPIIDNNNDYIYWDYSTRKNEVTKESGVAMIQTNPNPDDYLLIGPFKMNAGSTYTFHMAADGHNFTETVEVCVGTDPDNANSFTTTIIQPTTLEPMKGMKNLDGAFEPAESGDYYFGVHACTSGAGQYIYLYEVAVKELGGDAPAAPSDVDAIPGATTAEIRFTLPSAAINGQQLTSLTEARVYRDGELIGTITENVAPGAEMSFTDSDEVTDGFHSYTVSAVGSEGEGKTAQVQLWRGLDYPGRPTNLRFWEDLETPGLIHATFDHPKRGYYGGYINPDEIWYLVDYLMMGSSSGVLDLGYGTEATFQLPVNASVQDIFAGSVYGRNSKGVIANSSNWATQTAYVGAPLPLPVHESWAGMGQKSGIWGSQSVDGSDTFDSFWDIRDGSITEARPQDNDGGMLAIYSETPGAGKRVLSPRVDVSQAANPTLVFYYRHTTDALEFNLDIFVDDQPGVVLRSLDLAADKAGLWQRVEIPLDAYKANKYIQFGFRAYGNQAQEFVCIDNITISDLAANDLSVTSFSAPSKADVNTTVDLTLGVRNNGAREVDGTDYSVRFFKNGVLLKELEGVDIPADGQTTFIVTDTPSVTDPTPSDYHAEIVFDADMRPEDNISTHGVVRIIVADYPTVTDLSAVNGRGVELSWSDPDMSAIPGVSVTESFETYESFIIDNIGPWSLYDGDKCRTVILATQMGVVETPHYGEPMAWQVYDPAAANIFLSAWTARSGNKMLVSFQAAEDQNRNLISNDWLISPELNGAEQVISFYSRAGNGGASAPELFDFMVSSESDQIADFTPLASNVDVPYSADEWFEYTYRIPAGTRYFAIVHKSYGKVAMLVDDITYIPAGSAPVQLDLQGFNIYRDGIRLNEEPVADNAFSDTDVEAGRDYTYHVTPVYDKGEAGLSNAVTIKAESSIGMVTSHELSVRGISGAVRIAGGQGDKVTVYSAAGVCVAVVSAEGTVDVPVPAAGIYLVKVGDAVTKVAVR